MKKLPICFDAYLSDDSRHEVFNHTVSNFVKAGWEVFIISNKIQSFNQFHGVKYFEYDATNRVLADRNKYELSSDMYHYATLLDHMGKELHLNIYEKLHGFTNWTLFHNMHRMAETVKRFGHTHYIHCEYDVVFKNYDLMNTIFTDFGKTPESLRCMAHPHHAGFGCKTFLYLMEVENVLRNIPPMHTEDDYRQFLIDRYGRAVSPVYEKMFEDIFVRYVDGVATGSHLITDNHLYSAVDNPTAFWSAGDTGSTRRSYVRYDGVLICPINDNTRLIVWNRKSHPVFVQCTAGQPEITTLFTVQPGTWVTANVSHHVTVVTSDMAARGDSITYDLVNGWGGTATLTPV
jgi:hypothetical protein